MAKPLWGGGCVFQLICHLLNHIRYLLDFLLPPTSFSSLLCSESEKMKSCLLYFELLFTLLVLESVEKKNHSEPIRPASYR